MEIGSLMARGRSLIDSGRYDEAVRSLETAVRRQPEFPDLHNLLGLALSFAGEPLRAESHLQRALELNPDYAEAHLNLAILLFERNAYSTARDHLRDFNRIVRGSGEGFPDPALDDLARRHADLADRYRSYGLLDEAEAQLRTALQLRPAYGDLRLALARILFERAKLEDAAREAETLLRQRPHFEAAHLLRGRIEWALGRADAAREAWNHVRHGPAAAQARAYLEQMENDRRGRRPLGGHFAGRTP